jgi:hypothetical protein
MTPRPSDDPLAHPPGPRAVPDEIPAWLDQEGTIQELAAARDAVDTEAAAIRAGDAAQVAWAARWAAGLGRQVRVTTAVDTWVGSILEAGSDSGWVRTAGADVLVPFHAVVAVEGLPDVLSWTPPPRTGTGASLRRLGAAGRPLQVVLGTGRRLEGSVRAVGADALDLRQHSRDRGPSATDPVVTVPWAAVTAYVVAG